MAKSNCSYGQDWVEHVRFYAPYQIFWLNLIWLNKTEIIERSCRSKHNKSRDPADLKKNIFILFLISDPWRGPGLLHIDRQILWLRLSPNHHKLWTILVAQVHLGWNNRVQWLQGRLWLHSKSNGNHSLYTQMWIWNRWCYGLYR